MYKGYKRIMYKVINTSCGDQITGPSIVKMAISDQMIIAHYLLLF